MNNISIVDDSNKGYNLLVLFDNYYSPSLSERGIDLLSFSKRIIENGYFYSLSKNDDVLGILAFYANDIETKKSYLSLIAVKREEQNHGYGRDLLNFFEKESKLLNMNIARLEVYKHNENAIRFYKNQGYLIIDENELSYFMEKNIGDINE